MRPPFHESNTQFAFQLRFHFCFATHSRQEIFSHGANRDKLTSTLGKVCDSSGYHLLESSIETQLVRTLISLSPNDSPSAVVKTLKANISRLYRLEVPDETKLRCQTQTWSRGYFFRSVGEMMLESVNQYIAGQRDHHAGHVRVLAEYFNPASEQLLAERSFTHSAGQYNIHLVLCPVRHVPAIDEFLAEPLLKYFLTVAERRGFGMVRIAILEDHVHFLVALPPTLSPAIVAFAIMNNSSHWIGKRNPGLFRVWDVPGFWSASAYLGTVGDVTSRHVRNFLK